jgi:phage/plasmid-associated DNA primase
VLADFIAECFNEREDGKVTKAKAYQLYEEWAQNSGIKHLMTKRSLGNALAERGWSEVRLSHGNQSAWVGWAEKPDID